MSPRLRRLGARGIAPLMLAAGLLLVVLGDAIGGLVLLVAAWSGRTNARARRRQQALERAIEGVRVADVMETGTFVVAPQATLDTFADALGGAGEATVARVMRGDELLGLVGSREISRIPRTRWSLVHAADAMVAARTLPALSPDEPLGPAAERLAASSASGLPVVSEGRTAGILTRLAVGRTLDERAKAGGARGDRW